jgi:dTDP-4-dehydrorhamnose reductase
VRILVIGANGLIGRTIYRILAQKKAWIVFGTVRSSSRKIEIERVIGGNVFSGVDLVDAESVIAVCNETKPDLVINCAGITKHVAECDDPLICIPVNSLAPHRLARLCARIGARFIHISTDCVFSGLEGGYVETNTADSGELYGRSKVLGEVDYPGALTIRTSTIGHEPNSLAGLLEWFLSQTGECRGFSKAIFSGLPTITLATIIRDYIIPHSQLRGLYHLSADPINKFDLLQLIAKTYAKDIKIINDDGFVIDRSLDSSKFTRETGFLTPSWDKLINDMYSDYKGELNV